MSGDWSSDVCSSRSDPVLFFRPISGPDLPASPEARHRRRAFPAPAPRGDSPAGSGRCTSHLVLVGRIENRMYPVLRFLVETVMFDVLAAVEHLQENRHVEARVEPQLGGAFAYIPGSYTHLYEYDGDLKVKNYGALLKAHASVFDTTKKCPKEYRSSRDLYLETYFIFAFRQIKSHGVCVLYPINSYIC